MLEDVAGFLEEYILTFANANCYVPTCKHPALCMELIRWPSTKRLWPSESREQAKIADILAAIDPFTFDPSTPGAICQGSFSTIDMKKRFGQKPESIRQSIKGPCLNCVLQGMIDTAEGCAHKNSADAEPTP